MLGGRLARETQKGETVAMLLPNSVGFLVTLFGLNALGRVAAILNFTAGKKRSTSAVHTACIRTVLTSRRFLDAAKLEELADAIAETEWAPGQKVRIVALEDVRASLGVARQGDRRRCAPHSPRLLPPQRRGRCRRRRRSILFTSGTEGAPKGVVLTNANLMANARQMLAHMRDILGPDQVVFNPLPMFHSFGLTAATLAPLFWPASKSCSIRARCTTGRSPRCIERVKATVDARHRHFPRRLRPRRRAGPARQPAPRRLPAPSASRRRRASCGRRTIPRSWKATAPPRCAPVLAVNQPGANRPGTVGRLLPGIEARLEPVPGLSEGRRLFVRGPNVMAGYLLARPPRRAGARPRTAGTTPATS